MCSKLDLNSDIKLFPQIIDGHKAGALWSLCRGMDKDGAGKISFTMLELESILGVSQVTIFKYMSSNLFFKKEEICNNPNRDYSNYNFMQDKHIYHYNSYGEVVYTLYYKSITQIVEILCLENIKRLRYTYASPLELHKSRKKVFLTEVMVQSSQNSAYHAANRKLRKTRTEYSNHLLNSDDVYYNSSISVHKPEDRNFPGVKCLTDSVLLVNTDKIDVACASHTHVATQLGRHRTTISKRLKKSKIEKHQLYLTNKSLLRESKLQYSIQGNKSYYISDEGKVVININGTPYQKFCNIYKNTYDLLYFNTQKVYKKSKIYVRNSAKKVVEKITKVVEQKVKVDITTLLKPEIDLNYFHALKKEFKEVGKTVKSFVRIQWEKLDNYEEVFANVNETMEKYRKLLHKLVICYQNGHAEDSFEYNDNISGWIDRHILYCVRAGKQRHEYGW